ncbi:MAG: NAD(P)H-hydrate dehydratase [Ruminococcus sp.]|nr:NAD(P)H-hydrate dehydratase [Ruminococcus sp.]
MKYIREDFVKGNLPKRPDDANKGTMGTLLSICGSYSMAGACTLSSLSALRSGVGLLKVALPKSIYPIVSSSVYEAVFLPLDESEKGTVTANSLDFLLENAEKCTAVMLGCGLKLCEETVEFVEKFVSSCTIPMLIDADGINAIFMNIDVLTQSKADIVLTPHPKEMSRISGLSVEFIQSNRVEIAEKIARKLGVTIVLKGKDTVVTDGVRTRINKTGNCGMAKGGSGDVLSGVIASLMAQGLDSFEACCVGVYIHGLCGDLAAKDLSKIAMLPRDLVNYLPKAFKIVE